jgi:hypothetical protein
MIAFSKGIGLTLKMNGPLASGDSELNETSEAVLTSPSGIMRSGARRG